MDGDSSYLVIAEVSLLQVSRLRTEQRIVPRQLDPPEEGRHRHSFHLARAQSVLVHWYSQGAHI